MTAASTAWLYGLWGVEGRNSPTTLHRPKYTYTTDRGMEPYNRHNEIRTYGEISEFSVDSRENDNFSIE